MTTATSSDEQKVRTLLEIAGITMSESELRFMVGLYPDYIAAAEKLHAIPEARYGAPDLVFDPVPQYSDWAVPAPAGPVPSQRAATSIEGA